MTEMLASNKDYASYISPTPELRVSSLSIYQSASYNYKVEHFQSLFDVKCLDPHKGSIHWESMVLSDKWNLSEYTDPNGKTKILWQGDQLFRSTPPIRIREYIRELGPQTIIFANYHFTPQIVISNRIGFGA